MPPVVNSPLWAVLTDGTIATTDLESSELVLTATDGTERRVRSASWVARAPTEDEERILTFLTGERLEMLGGTADAVNQMPVDQPATLPVFTDMHAGPDTTLWVQRTGSLREVHPMATNTPDPPRSWGGTVWDVLDSGGRYLGSVELPPRLRVMEINDRGILGVQTDVYYTDSVVLLEVNGWGDEG